MRNIFGFNVSSECLSDKENLRKISDLEPVLYFHPVLVHCNFSEIGSVNGSPFVLTHFKSLYPQREKKKVITGCQAIFLFFFLCWKLGAG